MLYAIYRTDSGELEGGVFDFTLKQYYDALPDTYEDVFSYDFKARGKTYADRKDYVESKAIEFSNAEKPSMAYSELAFIDDGFYRLGKAYGLLTDFHENAIC